MLGGVVKDVYSNPVVGHKYFSAFTGMVDLLYLSISVFIINLYQFLILCQSLTPNIYPISLVFSESSRPSFAKGIDAAHKEELNIRRVLHEPISISVLFKQSF